MRARANAHVARCTNPRLVRASLKSGACYIWLVHLTRFQLGRFFVSLFFSCSCSTSSSSSSSSYSLVTCRASRSKMKKKDKEEGEKCKKNRRESRCGHGRRHLWVRGFFDARELLASATGPLRKTRNKSPVPTKFAVQLKIFQAFPLAP